MTDKILIDSYVVKQAQAEQKPVAWCALNADRSGIAYFDGRPIIMTGPIGNEHHPDPLYTRPQPPRQPLTDDMFERIWEFLHDEKGNPPDPHDFARAIERAHGIVGE